VSRSAAEYILGELIVAEIDNHIGSVFGSAVQAGHIDHVSFGPGVDDSSAKLAALRSLHDAAKNHETRLVNWLDCLGKVFVVLTLVPDVDGYLDINSETLRALRASLVGNPLIYRGQDQWRRVMVRGGWLIADSANDDGERLRRLACTLHRAGAGSIAVRVGLLGFNEPTVRVAYQQITEAVTNAIMFLAEHARDRTAARGNAVMRATITPVSTETPVILAGDRNLPGDTKLIQPPVTTAVAPLDGLVVTGPVLLAAMQRLVDLV
jgi:hypothetical protein